MIPGESANDPVAVIHIPRSIELMRSVYLLWIVPLVAMASGCSSVYGIRATVIEGKLAFVADTNFFGNPDCVRSITVEAVDGPPAASVQGDDVSAVKRGVYWQQIFAPPSCENPFPIKYGAMLSGPLFIFADGGTKSVHAKPLVRGATYEVFAESSGSAHGSGKFRLTKDGKVNNLPY